jgi:hypothetical protein
MDLLFINLMAWTLACALAFVVYYSFSEYRINPDFNNQLHCLSGVILCNRPLFSTLMCGFGGAVLLASVDKARGDSYALVLLILMFCGLLLVVHCDVRDYRELHFTSLGILMITGTLYVTKMVHDPISIIYFTATGLFVFTLLVNVFFTRWVPPYMTVQALMEMVWVAAFTVSVITAAV